METLSRHNGLSSGGGRFTGFCKVSDMIEFNLYIYLAAITTMHDNKSMSADKVINIITSAEEVLFVGNRELLNGFSRNTEWKMGLGLEYIQLTFAKDPDKRTDPEFLFSLSLTLRDSIVMHGSG